VRTVGTPAALISLLTSPSAVGLLVRRLLPVTIGLPIIVGALRLEGEQVGLYSSTVGHVIMITFGVAAGTGVLLWTGMWAERLGEPTAVMINAAASFSFAGLIFFLFPKLREQ